MVASKKHLFHCLSLFLVIIFFEFQSGSLKFWYDDDDDGTTGTFNAFDRYGTWRALILYFLRILSLLPLPQILFNFFGLLLFDAFRESRRIDKPPKTMPFLCFRSVTRGDFPELVNHNILRNLDLCLDVNLENFIIEVVTDKYFDIPKHPKIRLIVVPKNYQTRSGALFKARALQYCIDVNDLNDDDWIVHLDEETLLTPQSLSGIIEFVCDGRYQFGQGMITYSNGEIVNWLTTLSDMFRVAEDMGKLRFQFYFFHKPIFSWKGSYVVSKVKAETIVGFDFGPDGSIAEDCYFSMIAYVKGYDFNFINGEMWEKSPFTLMDFLRQRKRWLQGIYLVVHSRNIPLKVKFWLGVSLYAWITTPLVLTNLIFFKLFPLPANDLINFFSTFVAAIGFYLYIFGVFKSFSINKIGFPRYILILIASLLTMPLKAIIESIAVIWGMATDKHQFFVVEKQKTSIRPIFCLKKKKTYPIDMV
ncbi:beta-1,4-mannosyltransferase egh-like protein [Sarcoptes scabiei]|uniref:Beta-1,4-mannosyltransferase egh-like protein n=1 Tax=Sarcoptes scabiei TaxID=52283 RepID=A0A132ABW3_SARSC|nr:beta-1,4-mannosyltransferase egh-like protein [Sarcoptes scabiei]